MAGKYRKSSKRRSVPRRRKSTFKRRRTAKYSRPDGYHNEKVTYRQYLAAQTGENQGDCLFIATWLKALQNAGSAGKAQSVAAYGNTDKQFMQCATMYREYRVTGLCFKYTPVHYNDDAFF